MAQVKDKEILGDYADQGYYLKEYSDHVVTVCYKDDSEELAAFNQTIATPEKLQAVCERHHARLVTPVASAKEV